jgi:hypothetical protein
VHRGNNRNEQRDEGYYWVRTHAGDTVEIARWSHRQWWFPATHLPVLPDEVIVLSERLVPPDELLSKG